MTSSTKEPFKKLSIFDLARGYEQADRSDRNYARHHFNDYFTYRYVTPCDITALEGYISIEIAAFRAIGEVTQERHRRPQEGTRVHRQHDPCD